MQVFLRVFLPCRLSNEKAMCLGLQCHQYFLCNVDGGSLLKITVFIPRRHFSLVAVTRRHFSLVAVNKNYFKSKQPLAFPCIVCLALLDTVSPGEAMLYVCSMCLLYICRWYKVYKKVVCYGIACALVC